MLTSDVPSVRCGHRARKVAKQKRDAKKHSEEEALKKAQRDKEREKLKAQQAALDVASRYIAGDTTPR